MSMIRAFRIWRAQRRLTQDRNTRLKLIGIPYSIKRQRALKRVPRVRVLEAQ